MARPISFSVPEEDASRLAALRYGHPQQRCWVLWLVSQGLPLQRASELAVDRIEQLTGVRRERSQVHHFLRNTLGLNWRRIAAMLPEEIKVRQITQNFD